MVKSFLLCNCMINKSAFFPLLHTLQADRTSLAWIINSFSRQTCKAVTVTSSLVPFIVTPSYSRSRLTRFSSEASGTKLSGLPFSSYTEKLFLLIGSESSSTPQFSLAANPITYIGVFSDKSNFVRLHLTTTS